MGCMSRRESDQIDWSTGAHHEKPTDTHFVFAQHASSYTWLRALKSELFTLTLYPIWLFTVSIYIFCNSSNLSEHLLIRLLTLTSQTCTPVNILSRKGQQQVRLRNQFAAICSSIQKASETHWHTTLFGPLSSVMEPGATRTHTDARSGHIWVVLSRSKHLIGVMKAAPEWMMAC